MKHLYKSTIALLLLTGLVMSFQNCGNPKISSTEEVFISFDPNQNTTYDIVNSQCAGSECEYTLYKLDSTVVAQRVRTLPNRHLRKAQSVSIDQNTLEMSQEAGIYCDITSQSGFGDIYVSCPAEVQNDSGFYIKL